MRFFLTQRPVYYIYDRNVYINTLGSYIKEFLCILFFIVYLYFDNSERDSNINVNIY